MPFRQITPSVLVGSQGSQVLAAALRTCAASFYDGLEDTEIQLALMRAVVVLNRVRVFVRSSDTFGTNEKFELYLKTLSPDGVLEETLIAVLGADNVPSAGAFDAAVDVQCQEITPGTILNLRTNYVRQGPMKKEPNLSITFFFY